MSERNLSLEKSVVDDEIDFSLRPKNLSEFIGQEQIVSNLTVFIEAAKKRKETIDHILLYGPPGLGKTSLSNIIANELQSNIKITSAPAIEKAGDLAAILTNLSEGDVLFIDEIHRLNTSAEEILYSAMEDFKLDMIIGKGPLAKSIRIPLKPFTLIGATTRAGLLAPPLRDRFGITFKFELYNFSELKKIINRSANILNIKIEDEASDYLSKRARGTPRIANRLLKRIRDFAQVKGVNEIDTKIVKSSLDSLLIDENGLEKLDREILSLIITKFDGGPVGIETICASLGEDKKTIEDIYEPYLIKLGLLSRTKQGRVVSKDAYQKLGILN